jgi:hypothetical protein
MRISEELLDTIIDTLHTQADLLDEILEIQRNTHGLPALGNDGESVDPISDSVTLESDV